ncbi:hypothetical protein KOW79_020887 [Hemibagrus wyckioides]|uniref:Uncharacterized protein n=1 Tax=Hemibagrus wyckioides TaxID=337641 RepID=A0A9D3N4Q6_9TELE|nr:hypothetical protein KOW79_020887 [Hemibagrus wyckioides]
MTDMTVKARGQRGRKKRRREGPVSESESVSESVSVRALAVFPNDPPSPCLCERLSHPTAGAPEGSRDPGERVRRGEGRGDRARER